MSEGYVPQVGHLVRLNISDDTSPVHLVIWVGESSCLLVSTNTSKSWRARNDIFKFVADRSAEWARLFQLDTPTP